MSRQYPNPSVVEAIVDFSFTPGPEWNITVPGRMYDRVAADYPLQEPVYPEFGSRTTSFFQSRGFPFVDRIRLKASDETRLLQLGRDRLILNQLRPYPGWNRLKPHVLGILHHYTAVARPTGLDEVSVRYINQIDVTADVPLADLFTFRPVIEGQLNTRLREFSLTSTFTYDDGDELEAQLTAIEPTEGSQQSFVLDLDFRAGPDHLLALDRIDEWLDQAHGQIESAFERIIHQSVRDIMSREG